MVFSHCWVGSPGWLCLPATTSFEFLIRKPPCNYWINVNYESWLGLRHRYRYRRTRVELSLSLPPSTVYIPYSRLARANRISLGLNAFRLSFPLDLERCLERFSSYSLSIYLSISLADVSSVSLHLVQPLIVHLLCLCGRLSFTTTLLHCCPPLLSFGNSPLLRLLSLSFFLDKGLGIIKIRWLICKFNKITVLGMPGADKRLCRGCLYRCCARCNVWLSLEGGCSPIADFLSGFFRIRGWLILVNRKLWFFSVHRFLPFIYFRCSTSFFATDRNDLGWSQLVGK